MVKVDGDDFWRTFPPEVGPDRLVGPIGRVPVAGRARGGSDASKIGAGAVSAPAAPRRRAAAAVALATMADSGRVTPPLKGAPEGPLPPKKRRKHQPVGPRPHLGSITNAASTPEREATRKAPTVSWDDASPPPRRAEPAPPRGPPVSCGRARIAGAPAGKVQFRQVQVVPGENSAQDIHSFCIRRHSDPVPCPRVSGARVEGPPRAAVRVGLIDL